MLLRDFDDLLQKARDMRAKVLAAVNLSNAYVGAFRGNPILHIKFLVRCIDQLDLLLLTLTHAKNTVNQNYIDDAICILGEVVEAHNQLANEAIKESLEPIPHYIQESMDIAQAKLKQAKMQVDLYASPVAESQVCSSSEYY